MPKLRGRLLANESLAPLTWFRVGGAQVSEMHCNFLINTGKATGHDIETLGETVRERVKQNSGIELDWEIKRIGIERT